MEDGVVKNDSFKQQYLTVGRGLSRKSSLENKERRKLFKMRNSLMSGYQSNLMFENT